MNSFSQKQIEEINIVKRYLQNEGLNFKQEDIKPNPVKDNPTDVFWEDKKFQVVFADGKLERSRRTIDKRGKLVEFGKWLNIDEYLTDVIIKPLEGHKYDKKEAKGIICLLFCVSSPPLIGQECFKEDFRNFILNAELEQYFFDKIILVCPSENYRTFPLEDINENF